MKFHFGHGVAVVLSLFALMLAWFMMRAIANAEELVTDNYYEKELLFQQDIDKLERAVAHGEVVLMEVKDQKLRITFPEVLRGKVITGTLEMMRPSDARADQLVAVKADHDGIFVIPVSDWMRGLYRARLDWRVDGEDHLSEQQLVVP